MIKFAPNGDRVVIRPFTEAEMRGTKVSVILPFGQSKEAAQQGVIVESGPEAIYKVDDTVIFNPAAGDTLRVEQPNHTFIEYRIMHSDTVLCSFLEEK